MRSKHIYNLLANDYSPVFVPHDLPSTPQGPEETGVPAVDFALSLSLTILFGGTTVFQSALIAAITRDRGPDATLAAGNRAISWEGVSWCRMEDNKIAEGRIYVDSAAIRRQMRPAREATA